MFFSFGLRSKMILLSSFLLILPWFGYKTINEMEYFLLKGQENVLRGTTQAIAAALHNRPQLFNQQTNHLKSLDLGKHISAFPLNSPISFDGLLDDWQQNKVMPTFYGKDFTPLSQLDAPPTFNLYLGQQKHFIYGAMEVFDQHKNQSTQLNNRDDLILAFTNKQDKFQRYSFQLTRSGFLSAHYFDSNTKQSKKDRRITAYIKETAQGYNIEFRIPSPLVGDKFALSLIKTNNKNSRTPLTIVRTSNTNHKDELGTLLAPSTELKTILEGMKQTQADLQLIDLHNRIITEATSSLPSKLNNEPITLIDQLLAPIYRLILKNDHNEMPNNNTQEKTLLDSNGFIQQAINSKTTVTFKLATSNNTLNAVTPIVANGIVSGVILAKQSTQQTQLQLNSAIKQMTNVFLITLIVASLLLFLFSTNITMRIRNLRNQADCAIDDQGRILTTIIASKSKDEIGDLSRCLSAIIERQSQYHEYLENLSSRLSHELRTPIAVTRSSLENLSLLPQNQENKTYIDRAQTGVHQLNQILTAMSEATRIEQTLQNTENSDFPLNKLRDAAINRYQMTFNEYNFSGNMVEDDALINADPDFIMQLLDKLVSNAMDFSEKQGEIEINIQCKNSAVSLSVINTGPLLPEKMQGKLLDSMVSIRKECHKTGSNLGLGLYIANIIAQFYAGNIQLKNCDNKQGVEVQVQFPLCKSGTIENI